SERARSVVEEVGLDVGRIGDSEAQSGERALVRTELIADDDVVARLRLPTDERYSGEQDAFVVDRDLARLGHDLVHRREEWVPATPQDLQPVRDHIRERRVGALLDLVLEVFAEYEPGADLGREEDSKGAEGEREAKSGCQEHKAEHRQKLEERVDADIEL